jgi:hypothetical protein
MRHDVLHVARRVVPWSRVRLLIGNVAHRGTAQIRAFHSAPGLHAGDRDRTHPEKCSARRGGPRASVALCHGRSMEVWLRSICEVFWGELSPSLKPFST